MDAQETVDRPQNPRCHRDTACTGKRRYPSIHQAKKARKSIESNIGKPTNLTAYRCVYSPWVHLGGKDGGNQVRDLDQVFIESNGLMGQHEKPASQKRSTYCRRQANVEPITNRSIEDRRRDWNSDTPMPWPERQESPEPSVGCPLSELWNGDDPPVK